MFITKIKKKKNMNKKSPLIPQLEHNNYYLYVYSSNLFLRHRRILIKNKIIFLWFCFSSLLVLTVNVLGIFLKNILYKIFTKFHSIFLIEVYFHTIKCTNFQCSNICITTTTNMKAFSLFGRVTWYPCPFPVNLQLHSLFQATTDLLYITIYEIYHFYSIYSILSLSKILTHVNNHI